MRVDVSLLRPAASWRGEDLHAVRGPSVPARVVHPAAVAGCAGAALGGIYVLALWVQVAVYLPKEVVLLAFLGAAAACRQLRPFLRDWAVPLLLLFVMDALRQLAYDVTRGLERAVIVSWPIRVDQAVFGTLPTRALQSWLHPTPGARWYDLAMAVLHGSHFVSFLLVSLAVWVWRGDQFRRYATSLLFTAYAGLAGYFLVPTAPPWMAAELGHLPSTPRLLLSVPYLQLPRFLLVGLDTNPVAAMPSLHAAFSLLVALGLGLIRPWARRVAYLYVLSVGFAVVYGGEHYVVDLLAGYALAGLGFWLAGRICGGRPRAEPRGDHPTRARRLEATAVLALLAVFVVHCLRAERVDAPTYDEPTHLAAGYLHLTQGDFRFQVDHPPLAKMLAAVPLLIAGARLPPTSPPTWRDDLSNRFEHRAWAWRFLYGTPGNRADSLVRLGRLVTVGVAVGLLAVVWAWSRALHGPLPALLVLGLGAVDPNLVAHGHLVTPDVGVTAAMLAALYALWRTTRAARPGGVLAAGLCLGLGLATKYTAVLLVPAVVLLLALRALAAEPWPLGRGGRTAATRWSRLRMAAGIGLLILGVAWGTLWAVYRFHAAAAPETAVELADRALRVWFAEPRSWPAEAVAGAVRHRLLPEAWGFGILYLWADSRLTPRTSYLAERLSPDGWWYYFPATLGLKVPLPTLALAAVGAAAAAVAAWRRSRRSGPAVGPGSLLADERVLAGIALLIVAGIVLGAAMLSTLDIGLRQVLPVYPSLLLAAACGIHACLRAGRVWGIGVVAAALVWSWTASFAVAPYHLAYFNELAGGPANGARWLVDSNLDWGQALRLLPDWLRARGIDRVNLCYFGTADPAAYGFDHVPLPGCTVYRGPASPPRLPGYLAISATHLAGVHFTPELRAWYGTLLERARLVGVVGYAIYVYEVSGGVPATESQESGAER